MERSFNTFKAFVISTAVGFPFSAIPPSHINMPTQALAGLARVNSGRILGVLWIGVSWALLTITKPGPQSVKPVTQFTARCQKALSEPPTTGKITHTLSPVEMLDFAKGGLSTHFHGKKQNRRYRERWQMFIEHQYNPYKDLIRDQQGLILLRGKPRLRHEVYEYMVARGEDSVDTY
jgi:hypothetical protein